MWAHVERGLGNHFRVTVDQLTVTIKALLKHIQYRPGLITGFLGQTDLPLDPRPP
ncbi:hypothetical protein [Parafrankia elaeagni]|uniref:hypothetical protein n=1 Tax=Parafrankia elaeagni TaxID=222534 RepID=UPI00036E5A4F|nr:hypothetical protein [Parafrankia elaeagni]